MNENLRKTLLYFKKWNTYWNLTDENEPVKISGGKLKRYPLDFKPRISEGHYPHFDNTGVPMWHDGKGGFLYHYTTMFSFALGKWDFYMLNGESNSLKSVLAVADYVIKSGIKENESLLLREADETGTHSGEISAMVQGEAVSVLTRAWQASGERKYLEAARLSIVPFTRRISEGGVVGLISAANSPWYEEYVSLPLNHVLNGMIYSLWGLRDLVLAEDNPLAKALLNDGVSFVKKAIRLFDSGYWSYYWESEKKDNYIASMMYHNLHICQLTALYRQTGELIFKEYADKFVKYTSRPTSRLRALKQITGAKLSGQAEG